ncbi:protein TolQ [Mangrovitalea sediminis]|uniref:protein TolQ n=1 Tax=Mangrovitalea sediminis TaxID=1982043 RepID=UPI000BE576E0|nr:protein TolQ [Mangrovitalea sediminis]
MDTQSSVWSLVSDASVLVQFVMLLLALASIGSWWIIFQRIQTFKQARRAQLAFEERFWSGMDLGQLYREVSSNPVPFSGLESVFRAGFKEFSRLRQQSQDPDAVMDGALRAMRVALSREQEKLELHLPFLATVGSTSPYVGLFGTVWGIMTAFRGLAQLQQATLATVAPGISEALVATAMGLFAAIPAVIAYNRFSSRADALLKNYDTFAEEFSSILHRRVHSGERQSD